MSGQSEDSDKSFDPTPKKLLDARKKGEIARSTDLQTAAAYTGLTLVFMAFGVSITVNFGTLMTVLLDQSSEMAAVFFAGGPTSFMSGVFRNTSLALLPIFLAPPLFVILCIAAQRGFTFAPSKLAFKASRISLLENAKNKYGRSGLFEFAKSFTKLLVYALCLALFLNNSLPVLIASAQSEPAIVVGLIGKMCVQFLLLVVLISATIGAIDAIFQHSEHIRKNRMSRKEIMDETKDAEGDPHMKSQRRQRAQEIASNQMMADVPEADVIIVNPTHYAVALKWSKAPGTAPVCVAKGVDEVAARIREIAQEAAVPIHSDPPTARALHAVTDIGAEISVEYYGPVAAAIRFAEAMRARAAQRVW